MRDPENHTRSGPGFNRRDFLKGSGAAVAATAMVTADTESTAEAALQKRNVVPAGGADVTLNVNGRNYLLKKIEPRVMLLDALRNDLNLTGCKDTEDTSGNASGADTVIIDGKPVLASSISVHECKGRKITTVESLVDGDKLDDVVAGFVKHDAMQCGYCTPGFVMATRAFLNKYPKASLKEIRKGLGGNLCRCGTYDGITRCALEIAQKGGA